MSRGQMFSVEMSEPGRRRWLGSGRTFSSQSAVRLWRVKNRRTQCVCLARHGWQPAATTAHNVGHRLVPSSQLSVGTAWNCAQKGRAYKRLSTLVAGFWILCFMTVVMHLCSGTVLR